MGNKAKKDKTFKLTIGFQLILVFIVSLFSIALLIVAIILGIKVDWDWMVVGSLVLIGGIIVFFISAYIFLIINDRKDNKKKNEKIDPCELVKELESFWIEEAVAQKLANEFQPKNLEMLTWKEYQFSPMHYEFLYNSLLKYIKDDCSNEEFFLKALIIKNENSTDQSLLSFISSLSSFVGALLAGLTIKDIVLDKPKRIFYLSILNQLKEERRKKTKGNSNNDNDNADKS